MSHLSTGQGDEPDTASLLEPLSISEHPWKGLSMDFIKSLAKMDGYDFILIFVDRFSKYTTFIPVSKECLNYRTICQIHSDVLECAQKHYE